VQKTGKRFFDAVNKMSEIITEKYNYRAIFSDPVFFVFILGYIGELISRREGNDHEITVVTSRQTQRWISFYANLNCKASPCPERLENCWEILPNTCDAFVQEMKRRGVKYFLWNEKHWSSEKFDIKNIDDHRQFKELGRWRHQDTGTMILFEAIYL